MAISCSLSLSLDTDQCFASWWHETYQVPKLSNHAIITSRKLHSGLMLGAEESDKEQHHYYSSAYRRILPVDPQRGQRANQTRVLYQYNVSHGFLPSLLLPRLPPNHRKLSHLHRPILSALRKLLQATPPQHKFPSLIWVLFSDPIPHIRCAGRHLR